MSSLTFSPNKHLNNKQKFPTSMNCEINSKTKSEVTSPIPSCRRGDKVTSTIPSCRRGDSYRSRACTVSVLPLQGESEGVISQRGSGVRGGRREENLNN